MEKMEGRIEKGKNEKEGRNLIKEGLTVTISYRYVDTLERKREIECKKGRIQLILLTVTSEKIFFVYL